MNNREQLQQSLVVLAGGLSEYGKKQPIPRREALKRHFDIVVAYVNQSLSKQETNQTNAEFTLTFDSIEHKNKFEGRY